MITSVPAQEIKRRGIGMLRESVKYGPVWVISGNKPRYVVVDADEYRRERHEAFVRETLASVEERHAGLGMKMSAAEIIAEALADDDAE